MTDSAATFSEQTAKTDRKRCKKPTERDAKSDRKRCKNRLKQGKQKPQHGILNIKKRRFCLTTDLLSNIYKITQNLTFSIN